MPIYRRNGKWEIRLQLRGQKYYRQVPEAKNKEQARVAEADLVKEIYEGRYGKAGQEIGSADFAKFAKDVFLPSMRDRIKDFKKMEQVTEALCRYFKGKRLKDILPMTVEGFKRHMLTTYSKQKRLRHPATVKRYIIVLGQIFSLAVDNELIGLNPCRKVKWGRGQTKCERERVLSDEEEKRLMPELERYPETKAAVVLALNTGLRKNGILRLKDTDIDLKARVLYYTAKGGERKPMPLNLEAFAIVGQLARDRTPEGYLFHLRSGHNISSKRGAFHFALSRAGIRDFRFHDLRHTFSTRVRSHTSAWTVRDLMGHRDVKTTGIYVAESVEEMRAAVNALCERPKVIEARERFTAVSPK